MHDRKDMSFIELSNVSIVDKVYGQPANDHKALLQASMYYGASVPYNYGVFKARNPAGIPLIIAKPLGPNDMGVTINVPILSPAILNQALVGFFITERYLNFSQGKDHLVRIITAPSPVSAPAEGSQEYVVTPMGGVNSTTEYVLLMMSPDIIYPAPVGNLNPWDTVSAPKAGTKGYLTPQVYRADNFIALTFSGIGIPANTDITVTPIWVHADSVKTIHDLLASH